MAFELVSLIGGAAGMGNIENITVVEATNQVPPEFNIQVTEGPIGLSSPFQPFEFPPGTDVVIEASGDVLLQGVVGTYNPTFDARTHIVRLHGKGKQREFVRSAVQHETGRFENQTVMQIAQALAQPYGIPVVAAGLAAERLAEVIKQFQVRKGSTPWDELMRLLPQRAVTMHGTRDGKVELIAGSNGAHAGGLYQGENILRGSAELTDENAYAKYTVTGHSPLGYTKEATQSWGFAEGSKAKPGSHAERVEIADTDKGRAQKHAQWWSAQASGESTKATITVSGWRDAGGQFWNPGWQVFVFSPFLRIEQSLLIVQAEFRQGAREGTTTTLTLQDASSYGGIALGGGSSPYGFAGDGGGANTGGSTEFGGPR